MFGIDISGGQVGLDLVRARSEGVAFVISKAVAAYLPGHSVAEGYHSNIDRTIAAGTPKGHYLVPNAAITPESSAEFLATYRYRHSVRDVLALDNEPLDTYGVFWSDAEAARFFRRLNALTDHPFDRMWLYCPAYLTRQHGPFPECAALGVRFWWAAYGDSPTGQTPDHTPDLRGSIPRWDVHQFTSRAAVAGSAVDGNYSPLAVTDLFGGTVPNTLQGVIDYARSHPLRDGGTWQNWCASFVYRAGGFSQAFLSAMVAGDNAGPLSLNWGAAPPGAIHYWSGVGGDGHCAFELGSSRLLMASGSVTDRWGTAMGTITFQDYARLGIPYRGWSMRWGAETLTGSTTSGGGTTPIQGDDEEMFSEEGKRYLSAFGDGIVQQILGYGPSAGSYPTHNLGTRSQQIRNDVNFIHQLSPYSLKAIREAQADGTPISLSDAQVAALRDGLVAGVTAGLAVALEENESAVIAAIAQLPDKVRETIKAAL